MKTELRHIYYRWSRKEIRRDTILISTQGLWGLWILNPWLDSLEFGAAHLFLTQVAPEFVWGFFIVALAIGHLFALIQGKLGLYRLMTIMCMGLWIFVAWSFLSGNPALLGIPVYSSFAWQYFCAYRDGLDD
jgi:hypothetical protein